MREPVAEAVSEGPTATRLQRALKAGEFAVSVELDPPKGLNPTKIVDGAAYLREIGVEFINIGDSPMARVRMSSMLLARLLQERLDVETIVHFTTRDRNLMAIQSDLLGAHALGMHNILALTGDPVRGGQLPEPDGRVGRGFGGLIGILREMNEGRDAAGASLGMPASFHFGAALNLNMEDEPINLAREQARRKLVGDLAEAAEARGRRSCAVDRDGAGAASPAPQARRGRAVHHDAADLRYRAAGTLPRDVRSRQCADPVGHDPAA